VVANPRLAAGSTVVSDWLRLLRCTKVNQHHEDLKKLLITLDLGSHINTVIEPGSETINGAVDPFPAPIQYMGINHRRLHVPMSEEFLNRANVIAIFQQVSGEGVS
jgi:hypothetical protein